MNKGLLILFTVFFYTGIKAQEKIDSGYKDLNEIIIRSFEQNKKASLTTATVKVLEFNNADRNNKVSFVNAFNTIAGVRMEERSPGSYRINIRGSSVRSPFGVRNIKVYWNNIPVTDPGGNTYFNQFAFNNFSSIELYKGPASSIYGAGTGGLILINNFDRWQPGASLEFMTGSYNLQNIFASASFGTKDNRNQLTYAHNASDGYRIQSAMRRDNFTYQSQLKLNDKQQLSASFLYTDLYYQTPGALTLAEYNTNPKAARPTAGTLPSAVAVNASIWQKTLLAGFTNQYKFSSHFSNNTTLYGSFAHIKNSAIRNFERRVEPSFGARTVFSFKEEKLSGNEKSSFQLIAGSELQQGYFNTQVSKNKNGRPDTLQTDDDINNNAVSVFTQADLVLNEKWFLSAGISLNHHHVEFTRLNKYPVVQQSRTYRNQATPRFVVKRKLIDKFFLSVIVSKGFSPPTISELLPSTGVISTNLEAESGWNYEANADYSFSFHHSFFNINFTAFSFRLNNGLVQRSDSSGADYFVNAGVLKEKGLETHAQYIYSLINKPIDYIVISADYTYNHFRYGKFAQEAADFTGNTIPSVPTGTFSLIADISFKNGLYFNSTYYTASKIFLNDANTAVANAYHLLGVKTGCRKTFFKKYKFIFYAGADNLLNETYSLGNDINAQAGRFYNAAAGRNYFIGLSFQYLSKNKYNY